jgi:hypothetical protein
MDQKEAIKSLNEIQKAISHMKDAIESKPLAYIFFNQAVICIIGFLGYQLFPIYSIYIWGIVLSIGSITSYLLSTRIKKKVQSLFFIRYRIYWFINIVFAFVFWFILSLNINYFAIYLSLFFSLGFTVFGLWISKIHLIVGILLGIFSLIGWLFLNNIYGYWIAATCGICLFLSGLFLLLKNKK